MTARPRDERQARLRDFKSAPLEHDDFSSNRHPALGYCWSMIFSENRYPLFGITLYERFGPERPAALSARASATKPSTAMSSARAVGSRPAAIRSRNGSLPRAFRLWRSILRRWPNAAWATRSSARRSQTSGAWRGPSRTSEDVILGGGTNALGATSNRMRACVRQPASTDRRP